MKMNGKGIKETQKNRIHVAKRKSCIYFTEMYLSTFYFALLVFYRYVSAEIETTIHSISKAII